MRVLLLEDCAATAKSIETSLMVEGIVCDTVDVAESGIELVKLRCYDLLVIDLVLNGCLSGADVILRLRAAKINVPIMIISGLSSSDHKIKGLGFGADDYMTKPFNRGEMVARVQAIIRRAKGHSESVICFGPHGLGKINIDSRIVYVEWYGNVSLTCKEYAILELLALRKGAVITKEAFLNHLYGGCEEPHVKIVDVFCCKCRKKLNNAFNHAKKALLKHYKHVLENGTPEEIARLKKGRNDREILECMEQLENKDEEGGSSGIATLWGRGYVLREFNEKNNNKDCSNFNKIDNYESYWNDSESSDSSDSSDSMNVNRLFDESRNNNIEKINETPVNKDDLLPNSKKSKYIYDSMNFDDKKN